MKGKLCLLVEVEKKIVGYARCTGNRLIRFKHIADFGVCVLKKYLEKGIGKSLVKNTIKWADNKSIERISLVVVEEYGFVKECILIKDRYNISKHYFNV